MSALYSSESHQAKKQVSNLPKKIQHFLADMGTVLKLPKNIQKICFNAKPEKNIVQFFFS
jgi:hypothetical protein